jgi:hypothetical protein
MKPFECAVCGRSVKEQDALVRWQVDRGKKTASGFQIIHKTPPCSVNPVFFNRSLELSYVFAKMPEFIAFATRYKVDKRKFRGFIHSIEKGRSYIRRHNVDKKEVKRLIILMEGGWESQV